MNAPDVDPREGHVFVNNLPVASQAYRGPLLRFEQPGRSIFKGPDLGRYERLQPLPGTPGGERLPADVRQLLGWSDEEARSPGAYPFRP